MSGSSEKESNGDFLCGVVEGFYGRPWTTEQRQELFRRMRRMGLSTYVYAPKDDLKHRAYWRDLYTSDEADHLAGLIAGATREGVNFVYALSPGIDIVYSSPKDLGLVKKKLAQVAELGARSFALLFDDIEPVMSETDRAKFGSFAEAQVAVTNEVHETLAVPAARRFLFCPTEYCESRAVPSLARSSYLGYIGAKLLPPIDILWTGPRVISRHLSPAHLKTVAQVLQRKPLIWDNLHANDYDNRRVFFGPYSGRPMEGKEWMSGVLTNPNCEFEANFVALDSLAQWARADADARVPPEGATGAAQEAGGEEAVADRVVTEAAPLKLYHPHQALSASLASWLPEFYVARNAVGAALAKDPPPVTELVLGINTCATVTKTTQSGQKVLGLLKTPGPGSSSPSLVSGNSDTVLATEPLLAGPLPTYTPPVVASAVVNPFVPPPLVADGLASEEAKVIEPIVPADPLLSPAMHALNSLSENYGEPMDLDSKLRSAESLENVMDENAGEYSASTTATTTTTTTTFANSSAICGDTDTELGDFRSMDEGFGEAEKRSERVGLEDLRLLADLFYLPFSHGPAGATIVAEYSWLRRNSGVVRLALATDETGRLADEWQRRATALAQLTARVRRLYFRLLQAPNRSLVQDLYPYVWEVERMLGLVAAIVDWIGAGHLKPPPSSVDASALRDENGAESKTTNADPGETGGGEAAVQLSADAEPWVLRGGLIGELLHTFPLENAAELLNVRPPAPAPEEIYRVRPYREHHKERVMELCLECLEKMDCPILNRPDFAAHAFVGGFLDQAPTYSFIVERLEGEDSLSSDECKILGAVVAVPDAQTAKPFFREQLAQLRSEVVKWGGGDGEAAEAWLSFCLSWAEEEGSLEPGRSGALARALISTQTPTPIRLLMVSSWFLLIKWGGGDGEAAEAWLSFCLSWAEEEGSLEPGRSGALARALISTQTPTPIRLLMVSSWFLLIKWGGGDGEAAEAWLSFCLSWAEEEGSLEPGRSGALARALISTQTPTPIRLLMAADMTSLKLSGARSVFLDKRGLDPELLLRCGFHETDSNPQDPLRPFLHRFI